MAEQVDVLSISDQVEVPVALWYGIAFLTMAGCLGIYRELIVLWGTWTGDPLRSIGLLIPPASIVLTLRVWRQHHWELRGTWWGLLVIGASYAASLLRQYSELQVVAGRMMISLLPLSLPVYLYGSGIVLLFAGTRVWRRAWFPVGLLLLSQPVPFISNGLIDLPLQNVAARVARSFATAIGLVPTTPQLRLMFSPDYGMFIAPGCDGIRGAVTMGYVALVLGYLKQVSIYRWAAYVLGAVLLGYLFNFVRLCILVVYYRVSLGHPLFEGVAKQADYAIGSCLFLVATLLLLWLARRKPSDPTPGPIPMESTHVSQRMQGTYIKCAAFAVALVAVLFLPYSALRYSRQTAPTPESLAARMPKQVGAFTLTRTWYEQESGVIVDEAGAYSAPGSDELVLGVWVAALAHFHDAQQCWFARGLQPDILTKKDFVIPGEESVPLDTGFYDDGVTDSIVINGACTPSSCAQFQQVVQGKHVGILFLKPQSDGLSATGAHPVSIMLRIDRLHSSLSRAVTYGELSDEARSFLAGLDMKALSRAFQ